MTPLSSCVTELMNVSVDPVSAVAVVTGVCIGLYPVRSSVTAFPSLVSFASVVVPPASVTLTFCMAESARAPCAFVAVLSEVTVTEDILPSVSTTVSPMFGLTPVAPEEFTVASSPAIAEVTALAVTGLTSSSDV